MRRNLSIAVILLVIVSVTALSQDISRVIKDHYIGKYVLIRVPIPDAKSPMVIYPEERNVFDLELYNLKMERVGVGIMPNEWAIIKDVEVGDDILIFDLIGVGAENTRLAIPTAALDEKLIGQGSGKVRIKYRTRLEKEEDPIGKINEWLSLVMGTRGLVSRHGLSEEELALVEKGEVVIGMSRKAVFLVLGDPTETIRDFRTGILFEAWLYDHEDFTTLMITFRDGSVESIKEF